MASVHRRSTISLPLLLLALLLLAAAIQSDAVSSRRVQKSSDQIQRCGDMATRGACAQRADCRWCQSEALDDMCFSKPHALRLPQQVFSCLS